MPLIATQHIVTVTRTHNERQAPELSERLLEALEQYPPVRIISMTSHFHDYDVYRQVLVAVVEEV
jgi:hypothetical protein